MGIKPVGPLILTKDLVAKSSRSQPNILISDSTPPRAIIADFGSACPLATPAGIPDEGEEGAPSFMAPELFLPTKFGLERGRPSKEADVYALGMTMYQVLTGKPPFRPTRKAAIIRAVISGERPAKPEDAEEIGMTEVVWNLLRECWREDRMTRPNISDILLWVDEIVSRPPTPPHVQVTSGDPLSVYSGPGDGLPAARVSTQRSPHMHSLIICAEQSGCSALPPTNGSKSRNPGAPFNGLYRRGQRARDLHECYS